MKKWHGSVKAVKHRKTWENAYFIFALVRPFMSCDRAIRPGHRWFVSAQSWPSRSGKRLSGSCDPGEWRWWELLLVKYRKCVVDYQWKLRWFSNLLSVLVARLHGRVLLLTLCSDREATNTSKGSPVLICPPFLGDRSVIGYCTMYM